MSVGMQDWRCSDCNCLNGPHEAFCFRCGAVQPDDEVAAGVVCGSGCPCVAPTWPEVVSDDWGSYWVRADVEHQARSMVDVWDGPGHDVVRIGPTLMVRDPDAYADDGLLVAGEDAPDEAVRYVQFEAVER